MLSYLISSYVMLSYLILSYLILSYDLLSYLMICDVIVSYLMIYVTTRMFIRKGLLNLAWNTHSCQSKSSENVCIITSSLLLCSLLFSDRLLKAIITDACEWAWSRSTRDANAPLQPPGRGAAAGRDRCRLSFPAPLPGRLQAIVRHPLTVILWTSLQ